MKKTLLSVLGLSLISTSLFAQSPRMSIMEEFTSANCPPCAATNPTLWSTIMANESKIFLMKYQHKIPSADVMYNQNPGEVDARASYYSVNYNPFGKINGKPITTGQQYNDHPGYFNQSVANSLPATSPFQMTIQANLNTAKDSITATVTIKCTQAYTGTTVKLRTALIEKVEYTSAPGGNGEMVFENVMRKMYPDASGTTLPATWTVNQSQTFTLKGKVPDYVVETSPSLQFVAFIQDDANKDVAQAGVKPLGAPSGIDNVIIDNSVSLYPNPATDQLTVELDVEKSIDATIQVTNILGQSVTAASQVALTGGHNLQTVNTASLSAGVYFLNIRTEEGNIQKKFVKK